MSLPLIILAISVGQALLILFFLILVFLIIGTDQIEMEDKPYLEDHFDDEVQFSPQEFYNAITEILQQKEIPGLQITIITRPEGGWFSSNRLYLRIKRKNLVIDVCSFHFGCGQFISCRSGISEDLRKILFGKDS